jgi:signal transduction histidine kinase
VGVTSKLDLVVSYRDLLIASLEAESDTDFDRAYEWGRAAMGQGATLLDVISAHNEGLAAVAQNLDFASIGGIGDKAGRVLREALAPYEMAYLGFKESNARLKAINTELEEVAANLEVAREAAESAQLELDEKNHELEAQVARRTSELRIANAQLVEQLAQLERRNSDLQHFASVAAHDLQEPLRKVRAFGDLLTMAAGPELNEKAGGYLATMQASAGRMQELIHGLLAYARVGTATEKIERVDLGAVVADVVTDLGQLFDESGGSLVLTGQPPLIEAEPTQMRQLFQNLIGNALKYRREGVEPIVELISGVEAGRAVIRVKDNGMGFDSEHAERIFGIFERLHGRTEYEGTGIGLALCRRIVERHAGEISAESEPGSGSTFVVTLPIGGVSGADGDTDKKHVLLDPTRVGDGSDHV